MPFYPGSSQGSNEPLARYLPPIPTGSISSWLTENLPQASQRTLTWLLDPFGASPRVAVEAARAGYSVVVSANNPINRFLLEMAAQPPSEAELRTALAELANSRKGEERMEPHIRSLYLTSCSRCNAQIEADAFLWDRDAGVPFARIYSCQHCGQEGEFPTSEADISRAAQFASDRLHRARALERVAPINDPDRHHAEEALSAYLPRAVYALFTLINKLDGLELTPQQRQYLTALLLSACDQANTLWPHPTGRARPRQLTVPPKFRENNIWFALEQSVAQWSSMLEPVPVSLWPVEPAEGGGISIYEGRLKDFAVELQGRSISAVVTAFPRPNQAFWTLSALWSGWLWGQQALGPFRSVLRRRRYDWSWHSTALNAALDVLSGVVNHQAQLFGVIGEAEPGFVSAALIAADTAGFDLENLALRAGSSQAQITWKRKSQNTTGPSQNQAIDLADAAIQAARRYLIERGEPASFLQLHAAALQAMIHSHALQTVSLNTNQVSPPELLSLANEAIEAGFTYRSGLLRYGGSDKSLEIGTWWLREAPHHPSHAPLSDRQEMEIVRTLIQNLNISLSDLDSRLCKSFPGLFTPEHDLLLACLESYAECDDSNRWKLREQETPVSRRKDLMSVYQALAATAEKLGYKAEGERPLVWKDSAGEPVYAFYIIASAVFSEIVFSNRYPPTQSILVLPGSRSNLAIFKQKHNASLQLALQAGWRFLKFRHAHRLGDIPALDRSNFEENLALDPLKEDALQLRLL